MRQCQCGGVIRQHELTGNREAWTCNACARYDTIQRAAPVLPSTTQRKDPMDTPVREMTAAEQLLAHYPSTKALAITMTPTPAKGAEDKRYSSQIAAHGYDLAHKTMRIEFKHGSSLYDYHHVPPEKAAAITSCDSFGKWVESNLKGVHHYERVREPDYYK